MPIEQELTDLLKSAMRERDQRTSNVVRMIKTKVMERRTASGFKGAVDDALYVEVIAAYQKQLRRAFDEFAATGDKGATARDELTFEIAFCDRFLPAGLTADEARIAVRAAIAALGATDPKQAGRVVGEVMKAHKGRVEPGEVKRLAEEELSR